MPSSAANPPFLNPIDIPKNPGGMPQSGPPLTGHNGLRLNVPLSKLFMSGAVRRDSQSFSPNGGAALAASTAYAGPLIMPRAGLITAVYLTLTTVPTVATATLAVTANGVSMLAAGTFSVLTTLLPNVIYSVPLSQVLAVSPAFSPATPTVPGLPYLPVQVASGFPYPILVSYTEGASTVHSTGVTIQIEYEPDDFNG